MSDTGEARMRTDIAADMRGTSSVPRRDFIYWFGLACTVLATVAGVVRGLTIVVAWGSFLIGVCLAFPTAYNLGRRRG